MSRIIIDISTSVDGFVAGPGVGTALFGPLDTAIETEPIEVVPTPLATHVTNRLDRRV